MKDAKIPNQAGKIRKIQDRAHGGMGTENIRAVCMYVCLRWPPAGECHGMNVTPGNLQRLAFEAERENALTIHHNGCEWYGVGVVVA